MTEWRPVLGYEGLYEISRDGDVRRTLRGRKFKPEDIRAAKQMLAQGASLTETAKMLGASVPTVVQIKHGRTWVGDETYRACKTSQLKHYRVIRLCKDGKYRCHSVHRMVWEAFNGPIPGRLEINHKNLDRSDNRLENLELVTHQQNIQHAIDAYKAQGKLRAVKGTKGFVSGKHSKYS